MSLSISLYISRWILYSLYVYVHILVRVCVCTHILEPRGPATTSTGDPTKGVKVRCHVTGPCQKPRHRRLDIHSISDFAFFIYFTHGYRNLFFDDADYIQNRIMMDGYTSWIPRHTFLILHSVFMFGFAKWDSTRNFSGHVAFLFSFVFP